MKGVFVTATGTEVGKTLVACAIARFLSNRDFSPGVMKPAASGGMVMTVSGKNMAATGMVDPTNTWKSLRHAGGGGLWGPLLSPPKTSNSR